MQVSSEDTDEYKKMIKPQLKQAIDVDKDMLGGAPELVIGCLQPSSSDVNAKAAKKVVLSFTHMIPKLWHMWNFLVQNS